MAYLISQLRKNNDQTYMNDISSTISATSMISPNTFGGTRDFSDFALSGNFSPEYVYYIRFKIHKIPKYFYSGSKTPAEVSMYVHDADNLNLQIILKNVQGGADIDEENNPPEIIGTCNVPLSQQTQAKEYGSYSFVFTPSKVCNLLGFRINRVSFDAINQETVTGPRNWLTDQLNESFSPATTIGGWRYRGPEESSKEQIYTEGYRIIYAGLDPDNQELKAEADICTLENLVTQPSGWLKFGYQSRPGSLIVVNGEPIRLGRSGIYEINNGTIIDKFMIASPGGSDNSKIDAFLLDYAYKN